jgi:DNA-binding response OmpR family regulator
MRLLVVEDEKDLRTALKRSLDSEVYTVDEAVDGQDALEKIQVNDYDLIILDLNLPIIDGVEVCRRLRKENNNIPIIMLTARTGIDNKVKGLDIGADDYIEKPFAFRELLARIDAVLRRKDKRSKTGIEVENLRIDTRKKRVWVDRNEISLTDKEYGILEYLMRNKGTIIKSEELFEHVWDEEANPFSKTVKVQISNLRKKIDRDRESGSFIKTVKNRGYLIE